jgi:hypothetical protein
MREQSALLECENSGYNELWSSELESTRESTDSGAQANPAASIFVQNDELDAHLDFDISWDTDY